jgi:hypothetical protein
VIMAAPDLPANNASHVSFTVFPTGLIHPIPVMTTRFLIKYKSPCWAILGI